MRRLSWIQSVEPGRETRQRHRHGNGSPAGVVKYDACLAAALQGGHDLITQSQGADATVGVATLDDDLLRRCLVDTDAGAGRQGDPQRHGDHRHRLAVGRQMTYGHVHQTLAIFLEHQVLKDEAALEGCARRLFATRGPVFEALAMLRIGLQDRRQGQHHQQQRKTTRCNHGDGTPRCN